MSLPYNEFFPELQAEVRAHCSSGARALLGLTCKSEYALATATPTSVLYLSHALLFALARDPESVILFLRTWNSPQFNVYNKKGLLLKSPMFHDLKHVAIASGDFDLRLFVICADRFEHPLCDTCVQCAAQTRCHFFISCYCSYAMNRMEVSEHESFKNILTVEALRMQDLSLLKWLWKKNLFPSALFIAWDIQEDTEVGLESRTTKMKMDVMNWFPLLWQIDPSIDYPAKSLRIICVALLQGLVARQWTLEKIKTFVKEQVPVAMFERDDDSSDEEEEEIDVENEILVGRYPLCLFEASLEYRNRSVMLATWPIIKELTVRYQGLLQVSPFILAVDSLARFDDEAGTWGHELLRASEFPSGLFMRQKTFAYVRRLFFPSQ